MKIVAMLSGGMDSTAMCHYLLTQHPVVHDIHIHHVAFRYTLPAQRDKADAEQLAVDNIVSWLRAHCRPFNYSESSIEMPPPETVKHNDHLWVAMVGANLVNRALGTVMATARIATDKHNGIRHTLDTFNFLVSGEKGMGRTRVRRDTKDEIERVPAYWVTPIGEWTKAESLTRVPHDLLDLTTSCQRPLVAGGVIENCGACRTCKRISQARQCIAGGMTVTEANEWLRLNPPHGVKVGPASDRFIWPVTLEDVERMEKAGEIY